MLFQYVILVLSFLVHLHFVSSSLHFPLHRRPVPSVRPSTWHRNLQSMEAPYVPLHLGTGTHYTWLYVGSPPQRVSVIIDTGSHILAFPCSECHGCGTHTDLPFNMSLSSTLEYASCKSPPSNTYHCRSCPSNDQCVLSQSYTEGSTWTATLVEDLVWVGNDTNNKDTTWMKTFGTRMNFGCQTKETGNY